jgi:hypothetical protein
METEKALRLLIRQLKDIQSQASQILEGNNANESIESFSKYASELKEFILSNIDVQEIRLYVAEIPEINYSSVQIQFWQYLILPSWWISLYKDYRARNKIIAVINEVRGKYATLELLVKGL